MRELLNACSLGTGLGFGGPTEPAGVPSLWLALDMTVWAPIYPLVRRDMVYGSGLTHAVAMAGMVGLNWAAWWLYRRAS